MKQTNIQQLIPNFQGSKWLESDLPKEHQNWLDGSKHGIRQRSRGHARNRHAIQKLLGKNEWQWPQKEIIFISDLHADEKALWASLVASGGIKKLGKARHEFKLTERGKSALFVFGGDFFDKGPSNLALLDGLYALKESGAEIKLLAGNHDIRVLFGMRGAGHTECPRNGHFFIRMGAKAIPFLVEIRDKYLADKDALKSIPSKKHCQQLLYPSEQWFEQFPQLASWVMPQNAIDREMGKIVRKVERFEMLCEKAGITIREAYAAALKWQALFLSEKGQYHWFYKNMKLAYSQGSFLFVHAGLDDRTAAMLNEHGTAFINKQFKKQLSGNAFEFYYGPIANLIRTKYRNVDMPLSKIGTQFAQKAGIHAIVHGHRNLHKGQRIALRKGLVHFECDVTLDAGSRDKEGLVGAGAGATLIHPQGIIIGISTDYHKIKVFDFHAIKQNQDH